MVFFYDIVRCVCSRFICTRRYITIVLLLPQLRCLSASLVCRTTPDAARERTCHSHQPIWGRAFVGISSFAQGGGRAGRPGRTVRWQTSPLNHLFSVAHERRAYAAAEPPLRYYGFVHPHHIYLRRAAAGGFEFLSFRVAVLTYSLCLCSFSNMPVRGRAQRRRGGEDRRRKEEEGQLGRKREELHALLSVVSA